jgi:hypothetical protein
VHVALRSRDLPDEDGRHRRGLVRQLAGTDDVLGLERYPLTMAERSKTHADMTAAPISGSFEEIVRAMLATPAPPAGDRSTRKQKPKKKKAKR